MPEFMDEEQFAAIVAEALANTSTKVDVDNDTVEGSLSEVIFAVLDMYGRHGPVMFGD